MHTNESTHSHHAPLADPKTLAMSLYDIVSSLERRGARLDSPQFYFVVQSNNFDHIPEYIPIPLTVNGLKQIADVMSSCASQLSE